MNEFLLLALIIVYLAISYAPTSEAPKDTEEAQRSERSSQGNPDIDAARGRNASVER